MMKLEDEAAHAELRLSLQALQAQHQRPTSANVITPTPTLATLGLLQQLRPQQQQQAQLGVVAPSALGVSFPEQQLLLQQQLLWQQQLLRSSTDSDALPIAAVPPMVHPGAAVPPTARPEAANSAALARHQLRVSAADSWRQKRRRQAQNQDVAAPHQSCSADAAAPEASADPPRPAGGDSGEAPADRDRPGSRAKQRHAVPAEKRKEESRRKRLLRNRVSAQQARERKRSHMQELEGQCAALEAKNSALEDQIESLSKENDELRQVMKRKVKATRPVNMEEPAREDDGYGDDEQEI